MNTKTTSSRITIEISSQEISENVPSQCAPRGFSIGSLASHLSATRDYLRRLRAAEMDAWEQTGGDFLLPRCAPRLNLI